MIICWRDVPTRLVGLVAALFLIAGGGAVFANDHRAENNAVQAWISTSVEGDILVVSAGVTAAAPIFGSAEMAVFREGTGGSVATRQASEFSLGPGQSSTVGRVSLNLSPEDSVRVTILATKDGIVLSKMEISIPND